MMEMPGYCLYIVREDISGRNNAPKLSTIAFLAKLMGRKQCCVSF